VSDYTARMIDSSIELGRANQITVELARRHCLHMTFTEWGGRGIAEEMSGLPINARRVSCPYAQGDGAAMNLDWVATDFYNEHCVGCEYRRPTGDVPNLASVIEDRLAVDAAARAEAQTAIERRRDSWRERTERRRGLAAAADPAMVSALDDIAVLDVEPGTEIEAEARAAASRRLTALAEEAKVPALLGV